MNPTRRSLVALLPLAVLVACERPAPQKAETSAPSAPSPAPTATAAASGPVITMLGDSITAGYGLPAADALPAQLEAALSAAGLNARVRAAGVSGDTTADGLARLAFSVQDDTALCIVALGGNDMLKGVEPSVTRANLTKIVEGLQARKIPILLAGMRAPPQYGLYAAEFDRLFAEVAEAKGVELYPFLLDGVALDDRYNQDDHIHPNPAGVKIIAAKLAPVVAARL